MTATAQLESHTFEHHKAHGPQWEKWLGRLKGQPGARGLEIGTWLGESACWFLENILTHPTAVMECVDPFTGSAEHQLAGIDCTNNEKIARERLARFGERVIIHKMTSDALLLQEAWRRPHLDFAYVDGAHDAMNVLRDSVLAFDLLKVGGVMIWDDYEWAVMQDPVDRPKLAIVGFLAAYARRLEIIGSGWQVAARKVA